MSFRRKLMSSMNTLTLSEQSKTVTAASGSFSLNVYYNESLLKASGVSVTKSGIISSATYNSSTGKLSISYPSNSDSSNKKYGSVTISYLSCVAVFDLTQNQDSIKSQDGYAIRSISGSITDVTIPRSYSGNFGDNIDRSGTCTVSGTLEVRDVYDWYSGKYTTSDIYTTSFGGSVNCHFRADFSSTSGEIYFSTSDFPMLNYHNQARTMGSSGGFGLNIKLSGGSYTYTNGSNIEMTRFSYLNRRYSMPSHSLGGYSCSVNTSTGAWTFSF